MTFTGEVRAQSFRTESGATSTFRTTSTATSGKLHALAVLQDGTAGEGVALNVVSKNPEDSAMYLTGHEKNSRGTLKISHFGYVDASDGGASALSIDLKTTGVVDKSGGTAAQGIYVTATTGATKGNLITLRNNNVDDFVVKGSGRVGIGIPVGSTPGGRVEISQRDATIGLLMAANSDSAGRLAEFRDRNGVAKTRILNSGALAAKNAQLGVADAESYGGGDGVVGIRNATTVPSEDPTNGGVLFAENGALKWRGSNGTVTVVAPS
ncbi:hyaluronoglucosaminidase [Streptomyces enissocaesilis]|uniref:hyaluronoglucosaminidase n=1 Tax=Streptomyces enissocaesilis TaxID=332589 RepID=UPI0031D1D0C1